MKQEPKSVADKESEGAFWVTLEELEQMSDIPPPKGLRGDELLVWGRYLKQGGPIYPLGLLMLSENVSCKYCQSGLLVTGFSTGISVSSHPRREGSNEIIDLMNRALLLFHYCCLQATLKKESEMVVY